MNVYDVIISAGQSNAEGSGIGRVCKEYKGNANIFELVDKNSNSINLNDNGFLSLVKPYEYVIQEAKESSYEGEKRGNFAHSFVEEYIRSGGLKNGRKVLIIKSAVGGTGFAKNHWGKGNDLQERLFNMIDYVLSLNKDNKIIAFLWHQGEHDAFENSDISPVTRERYYYDKFSSLICRVRENYGNSFPIIAGGFSQEWSRDYVSQCDAVIKATKRVLKENFGAFVSSNGLKTNNQCVGNGDTIHFCRSSLYKFGKRYFNAYKKLMK